MPDKHSDFVMLHWLFNRSQLRSSWWPGRKVCIYQL